MRLTATTIAITVTTVASLAIATPHGHQHRHAHKAKRAATTVTDVVAGPTAYVYVMNGNELPVDEVCAGVDDGALAWASGEGPPGVCATAVATAAASSAAATSSAYLSSNTTESGTASSSAAGEFYQQTTSSTAAATSAAAATALASSGGGLTAAFPNGELDCSTFPSDYGAVYIDYLNLGGWTGLQAVTIEGSEVTNIVTGVSGDTCVDGMMCSYACPPGYQKSQWPSTQGSTGQSVGGLSCSGGKLYLTNPSLSSNLCVAGVGGVQATNNAGSVVSICRTDYPGTESETIPTVLEAGETQPLTVPDAASYYVWEGKSTSAQYYLNPPGYSASQACLWGSSSTDLGNFAPINFGVGASDGTTWLSIIANTPTTTAVYPGTVEITGNISGSCKYENGQFCDDSGCNDSGCTVSLTSGTAIYMIY